MNCKKCTGELVVNTYHRAMRAGAVWYCPHCDGHITPNGEHLVWREGENGRDGFEASPQ